MMYMEIALLPKKTLRIKGKISSIVLDPKEKTGANAAILFSDDFVDQEIPLHITGAGEYEIGGIKITGIRSEDKVLFSMNIDGIDVLLGKLSVLEKMQHKLKEHNIVIAVCETFSESAFLTSLATNSMILIGNDALALAKALSSEKVQLLPKYQTSRDKLPQEVETIVLQ